MYLANAQVAWLLELAAEAFLAGSSVVLAVA